MHVELEETANAQARVGLTLRGKWRLDALIDVGGMAAVYAATHRNGMRGAVKILHPHRSRDPDVASRFRREGYIANKVAHPNAVHVLDDDVDDDGNAFLVMELLEGTTLSERARACGGRLPVAEVLAAVDQILDVLAAAHDLAIVHRDVKPENVFVETSGRIKVLDFGIARLAESELDDGRETMSGMPMGSPAYMSPEQARGRWDVVGPQSDLWSVGATMFTLLSGRDVHVEETVPELLAAIFSKQAPSLATVMPDCDPRVVAIVDRALQLRLADRWPDARSMQEAVRSVLREPAPEVHAAAPEARAPAAAEVPVVAGRPRRLLPPVALAAGLVLAGIAGITVAERDSRSAPKLPETAMAELGDATAAASAPGVVMFRSEPAPRIASPPPAPPPPARATVQPVTRAHRRSIYDRRF